MVNSISTFTSWIHWLTWRSAPKPFENSRLFFQLSAQDVSYLLYNMPQAIANRNISNRLHWRSCTTAKLETSDDGMLSFEWHHEGHKKIRSFQNEKELNKWLAKTKMGDIWEIEDLRLTSQIMYKFQATGATYYNRNELFAQLAQECGVLWKLIQLEDGREKYFRAKRDFWGRSYYQEVDFDCLANVVEELDSSRDISSSQMEESSFPQSWWKKMQLLVIGGLAISAYRKCQNRMPEISLQNAVLHGISFAKAVAFSSLFRSVKAQNSPPVVVNPSPYITVYPGQPFDQTFSVDTFFMDPEGDALAITFASVPEFVHPSIITLGGTLLETVNTTIFPLRTQREGDLLHVFGTQGYEIWNASAYPLTFIGSYPFALTNIIVPNHSLVVVSRNFVYLVSGTLQNAVVNIINITNPFSPTLISTISSLNNYPCGYSYAVALDNIQDVLWISDTCTLSAYSIKDPASPVYLNTINSLNSTTSLTLTVDSRGFVCFCDPFTNFQVLNGTNPTNSSIVFESSSWICSTSSINGARFAYGFFSGQSPNLYVMSFSSFIPTLYTYNTNSFYLNGIFSIPIIPQNFIASGLC